MQRELLILKTIFLSMMFLSAPAAAAEYYVATSGQDTNPGTKATPFRTLKHAVKLLQPGDILYIRGGTYRENLRHGYDVIPSGTSWSSPIVISGYSEESVTIRPDSGGTILGLSGAQKYLIFRHIVFDAINVNNDAVSVNSGSEYIRFEDCDIKNAGRNGVLVSDGSSKIPATNIEFINVRVYGNGRSGSGHGIYISTSNNMVDSSQVYENQGAGIHVFNGSGNRADHNTVRNTRIHSNETTGLVLSAGTGNRAYNNIIWNNSSGISVSWQNPIDAVVYNNTVYNNESFGIVLNYASNTMVANNIFYSNKVNIEDNSTGTSLINNLTMDPLFVNIDSLDFSLQASSPAIDAGIDLPDNNFDFLGQIRPQGAGTDIGAIEFRKAFKPARPRELKAILE